MPTNIIPRLRLMLPTLFLAIAIFDSCNPPIAFGQGLPRIVQGEVTDDYEAVGIVRSLQDGGFCTGTLISATHVLPAAHCAEFIESATDGTFEVDGKIYGTSQVFVHEDYDSFTLANDIAILELSESVTDITP